MALLQGNGDLRLFCGFAVKKVTATMLSPSYMVAVFFFFFVAYGLVH